MEKMEKIEMEIDLLHEEIKKMKEEQDNLRKKSEIIDVIICIRSIDFRRLRDLKISMISTSFPRSENILEKITVQMDLISFYCTELCNKKIELEKKIQRNNNKLYELEKRQESLQRNYPESYFRCCRC